MLKRVVTRKLKNTIIIIYCCDIIKKLKYLKYHANIHARTVRFVTCDCCKLLTCICCARSVANRSIMFWLRFRTKHISIYMLSVPPFAVSVFLFTHTFFISKCESDIIIIIMLINGQKKYIKNYNKHFKKIFWLKEKNIHFGVISHQWSAALCPIIIIVDPHRPAVPPHRRLHVRMRRATDSRKSVLLPIG